MVPLVFRETAWQAYRFVIEVDVIGFKTDDFISALSGEDEKLDDAGRKLRAAREG
jgi:hypothetical protein